MTFPFAFWAPQGPSPVWPLGSDGALHITTGNTVTLSPGTTYDYSSITIDVGGTLNVSEYYGDPVIIGCSGNFILNGTLAYNNSDGYNVYWDVFAPNGQEFSYSTSSGLGGGYGGNGITGGGESPGSGDGGTGGDGYSDVDGQYGGGGGGSGNPHGASGSGGESFNGNPTSFDDWYGGGGGGGQLGICGGGLLVVVKGNISGVGTVDISGGTGGAGGSGGNAGQDVSHGQSDPFPQGGSIGGGGGGGGNGGDGGRFQCNYHGTNTQLWTINLNGGSGGSGGPGGGGYNGGFNTDGSNGDDGSPGNNGTSSIASY